MLRRLYDRTLRWSASPHAETALAPVGGHGAVHAARFALHQLVRPWRSGSIESRSASTVSPAMARWPRQASDLAPFGR